MCNYANSISEYCTFIACLDVIGDAEQSYANYIYMRRKLKEPNKLIACFHANEPIEYLYKYLTYVDSYGKLSNLALGGVAQLPGSSIRPFLDMCEPICSKYPDVWIHAFGLTNFPLVECYSFIDSIDSTKHIMQPIYGHLILPPKYKCISKGKVLGLSKFARIADMVGKRLQLQERIGADIAEVIQLATGSNDVLVVVEGEHSCMTARGIKSRGAKTRTATIRGAFDKNVELRKEAYSLMNLN